MTASRKNALVLRWAILSAAGTALFWGSWYLIVGSVPVVTEVQLTEKEILVLPFGVSRWWDILFAPLWTSAIIMVLSIPWGGNYDDNLAIGLVVGPVVGLFFGLLVGLFFGLLVGLLVGLIFGLVLGRVYCLTVGLVYGLIFGLTVGLVYGLIFGLTVGLIFGLAIPIAGIIGAGIRTVCSLNVWKAAGRFLTAQDKKV